MKLIKEPIDENLGNKIKDENLGNKSNKEYVDGKVCYVPVHKINVNPGQRIKLNRGDFKKYPKYIALKLSMQLQGLIHSITVKPNLDLIAGFWRYSIAIDLGWKTIRALIKDVTEKEALLIEVVENNNRTDFSNYEFYVAIGKLKLLHEEDYPDAGPGKYNRNSFKNKDHNGEDHEPKYETRFVFAQSQKFESFTSRYSLILGLTMRSIQYKVLIAEAILNNEFSQKTVSLLIQGKISQNKLRSILKKQKRLKKQNLNKKEVDLEKKVLQKEIIPQKEEGPFADSSETKRQNLKEIPRLEQVKQVYDLAESTYNEDSKRLEVKVKKKKESKNSLVEKRETLKNIAEDNKDQGELKKGVNDPYNGVKKTFIQVCPHCNKNVLVFFTDDAKELIDMTPLYMKSSSEHY